MRERLIELICKFKRVCNQSCSGLDKSCNRCMKEQLADYILADGWIRPPCKVGDFVYLFYPVRKGIYEAVVEEICLTEKSNFIVTRDLCFNRRQSIFFEQIGKTVFLTKEEAENALKERERE